MRLVYSSGNGGEFALVRSVLGAAQIPYETRNEGISQAMPTLPFEPEIWVAEERFDEVRALIAASLGGERD
jgi:hypothetical protein